MNQRHRSKSNRRKRNHSQGDSQHRNSNNDQHDCEHAEENQNVQCMERKNKGRGWHSQHSNGTKSAGESSGNRTYEHSRQYSPYMNCDSSRRTVGQSQYQYHQRRSRRHNRNKCYPAEANPRDTREEDHSKPSTSSSTSTQADGGCDIPGYYYDEEKKTYFKILPNSMSSVSSFVTKENIKRKEAEQQRLSDLKNSNNQAKATSVSSSVSQIKKTRAGSHLVDILKSVQCGQFTCENLRTYMIRHSCSNVQPGVEIVQRCPALPHVKLEGIQKMDVNQRRNRLLCVSSLTNCLAHCVQLMSVKEEQYSGPSDRKRTTLNIKPTKYAFGPIYKKVSSISWAPVASLPGKHTVLITVTCPAGYLDTIAYVVNLEAPMETAFVFELNLGFKTVWSSAWNRHRSRFSVGSERKCHLVDVATRRKWTFSTYNSDPLSQLFSPTESNIMYNGTREGLILTHDMRARGNHLAQSQMRQGGGVGCLRLQQDENYILASDFSGTICLWDRRMHKKLMQYKGLVNSHYQLPFQLDETESVICSSGSDSYTKLWDVRSGELLKSLPPPYPASLENFPLSLFSTRWGNRDGNSAVIVAMRDKFKVFS